MMPVARKIIYLFGSEEEKGIREELQRMELNGAYNTTAMYTPKSVEFPDGLISFVERHMRYLNAHPKLDAGMYLANLRLMTRTSK